MEFRSGVKVEVWCKKQVAWRLAEMISSRGNYLFVRYDYHPGTRDIAAPTKVSKERVRPRPPVVAFKESFGVGDVVEVRALYSWNAATILRVISEWFCLVRLLGSGEEVNVTRTNIRAHQAWEQHGWTTLGKVHSPQFIGKLKNSCSFHHDENLRYEVMPAESRTNIKLKDDVEAVLQDSKLEGFPLAFHRRIKRLSPTLLSNTEASSGYPHKRQATGRKNMSGKLEAAHLFHRLGKKALEKVDNVAYTKDIFGERNLHAYPGNQHASSLETKKEDPLGHRINIDYDGCDTDASSVGSCSIIDESTDKISAYNAKEYSQNVHVLCSDAESCSVPEDEEEKEDFPFSPKELVAKEVHGLELHAYHKMLQALYASGSISWEQEALLTNLRLSLNISNDEHLIEDMGNICTQSCCGRILQIIVDDTAYDASYMLCGTQFLEIVQKCFWPEELMEELRKAVIIRIPEILRRSDNYVGDLKLSASAGSPDLCNR